MLNDNTEFIYESIFSDDNILTIKKTGKLAGHTGPHGAKPTTRE